MPVARANKFTIMMSDEEKTQLQSLADAEGLDASSYVRSTIRRAYAEKFGDKKPKAKR